MSLTRSWTVESESTPGKFYEVKLFLGDYHGFREGSMTCDCMSWRFQRRPVSERSCKHILWVQRKLQERDEGRIIREMRGSEISFNIPEVENGRLRGLLDGMKL